MSRTDLFTRIAALVVVMTGAANTAAAESGAGWYGTLRTGVSAAQTMNMVGSGADLKITPDAGRLLEAAIGYRFDAMWRGEITGGYSKSSVKALLQEKVIPFVACGQFPGSPCVNPNGDGSLAGFSSFGMAYLDLPVGGAFRPYVGAGIGVAGVNADIGTRASFSNGRVSRFAIIDATDAVVAYRGKAGFMYPIGFAGVDVAYSYTLTGRSSLPARGAIVQFNFDRRQRVHALSLGLTYKF